jgi:cytoskeletal protein RodZ
MADEDLRPLEEAASPRPEPTDDFPGTEPVEGEDPTARSSEPPPPPEEIPPERAGEIPTAEEVPAPRTEAVPGAEDVSSGTPPQAPTGDVQRETSSESPSRGEETPLRAGGASLDTPLSQEEMIRRQAKRDRGEEDKGLTDEVRDAIFDEDRD